MPKKEISEKQVERHRQILRRAGLGKFEGGHELDREIHAATFEGFTSTVGDTDTTGAYSYLSYSDLLDIVKTNKSLNDEERKFLEEQRAAIVFEDSQGFVSVDYFKDETTAERRFVKIEQEISDQENPGSSFRKETQKKRQDFTERVRQERKLLARNLRQGDEIKWAGGRYQVKRNVKGERGFRSGVPTRRVELELVENAPGVYSARHKEIMFHHDERLTTYRYVPRKKKDDSTTGFKTDKF